MSYFTPTLRRYVIFSICCGISLTVEYSVTHSAIFKRLPESLTSIITVCLIFLPVLLFYWIIINPLNLSKILILVTAIASWRLAFLILPTDFRPFNISWPVILSLLEISVFILILVRAKIFLQKYRTLRPRYNQSASVRISLEYIFGRRVATLLFSEIQLFRFSLFGWWKLKNDVLPAYVPITSYHDSGQTAIVISLLFVCLIECIFIHLLITKWSTIVATVVTTLSIYGMMFLLADLVATHTRPSFLTSEALYLRLGLRWQTVILYSNIVDIISLDRKPLKELGLVSGVFAVAPNTLLILRNPVWIEGPYGIRKKMQKITLFIDDKATLHNLIAQKFINHQ